MTCRSGAGKYQRSLPHFVRDIPKNWQRSGSERLSGIGESGRQAFGIWRAALGKVFAAAAASAELGQRLLQQGGHVVRLARGLGED